jgi:hypothetical protein
MFTALFTIEKNLKSAKCAPTGKKIQNESVHTMEHYSAMIRNETLMHNATDKPQNHYAEWKKDTKGHIWLRFHFYEISRIDKPIYRESRLVVAWD